MKYKADVVFYIDWRRDETGIVVGYVECSPGK